MSNMKTCVCCKKTYEYCGHCNKNAKRDSWKNLFCSENCRDIFKTIQDYVNGHLGVSEAKEKLSDLNTTINTTEQINKYIVEIMAYKPPRPKKITSEEKSVNDEIRPIRKPRKRRTKKVEE